MQGHLVLTLPEIFLLNTPQFRILCHVFFPFPLPCSLYLIFSPTKDNHKSNEGNYSPESNQSRKRTSSPGVFSWHREVTCGEQVIKHWISWPRTEGRPQDPGKGGWASGAGEGSWEFQRVNCLWTSFVFVSLFMFEEVLGRARNPVSQIPFNVVQSESGMGL